MSDFRYYAIVDESDPASAPSRVGLLRLRVVDGDEQEETWVQARTWVTSTYRLDERLGHEERRTMAIPPHEALELQQAMTRAWADDGR